MSNGPASPSPNLIVDAIGYKAIPSLEQGGMQHVVIARKAWREVVLPPGITLSHKKLVSRRTGVHGPRLHGNASAPTSQWQSDDQETTRTSMLVCVSAGQADYQLGNYVLHCPEGTFIFIPPGVPHPRGWRSHLEGENRKTGSCDLLWFSTQGRRLQCWMCSSRGEVHTISRGHENLFLLSDQLASMMTFLQEEAVACQTDFKKLFEVQLRLFLLTIHREIKEGRYLQLGVTPSDEPAPTTVYDPIVRAHEYIKAHLSGSLTIDKVAHAVHMSRAQFTRRFHQQSGQTFIEYVSALRIEKAQVLLRETDWSVAQVSEFVGFRSPSYFHNLFRRTVGTSPLDFRSKNQPVKLD